MAPRKSTKASVLWNNVKVAKITNIEVTEQRNVLDDTGIGQFHDTAVYGGMSTTLTGTMFYNPADPATVALMNRIRDEDDTLDELTLETELADTQGSVSGNVLISQQSVAVAVRELMKVQVSFTVSGGLTGVW